jgi:hypothetical protein
MPAAGFDLIHHLLVDECDAALRHVPKVEVIVVEG